MGVGDIGLDLPDMVVPGQPFAARVLADPHEYVRCTVHELDSGLQIDVPPCHPRSDYQIASITLPAPGLYSVQVGGSGYSEVGDLVLAADPSC
jgi:hypothetical protein